MSSFASFDREPQYPYFVQPDGTVDLSAAVAKEQLAALVGAVNARRTEDVAMELRTLERSGSDDRRCSIE